MIGLTRIYVRALKNLRVLDSVAIRLTKLTGKSSYFLHPKHLVILEKPFYLPFICKNDRVLDLGSGEGQHVLKIAKLVKSVVGVELNENLLEIAKSMQREKKIKNVTFQQGDIENPLSFKSNYFDKVLFLDVLEHLYRPEQVLRETRRVVKHSGLIFLTVPNRETSWKKVQRSAGVNYFTDPDHKLEFSQGEIIDLCRKVGFKIKKIGVTTYDTPLAPLISLIGGLSLSAYAALGKWKRKMVVFHPQDTIGFSLICEK